MIKTRIRLYEQSLLGLRREKLSWTPLKHTTAKQLKTKNISVQISCLFCAFLCMCLDGCFSVFLLTLNKSKNLVVILLTLNKSKNLVVILLTLNKSKNYFTDFEQVKKTNSKTPMGETGCLCIFFLFRPLPHVTDTPPWLPRPMGVSTSSELYPNTWLFFSFFLNE